MQPKSNVIMMKMLVLLFGFWSIAVSVNGDGNFSVVKTSPCDKEKSIGILKEIRIAANCTDRCVLMPDTEPRIEIDLDPGEDTAILVPKLTIKLGPIEFPLGNLRKDVCSSVRSADGKSCPLKKGSTYTYSRPIPIESYYPSFPVSLKWKFLTENNSTAICALFKVIIAND